MSLYGYLEKRNFEFKTSFHIIKFDYDEEIISIYDPNLDRVVATLDNNNPYDKALGSKFNIVTAIIETYYDRHSDCTWEEAIIISLYSSNFISFI